MKNKHKVNTNTNNVTVMADMRSSTWVVRETGVKLTLTQASGYMANIVQGFLRRPRQRVVRNTGPEPLNLKLNSPSEYIGQST